jgi:hypothetical protein
LPDGIVTEAGTVMMLVSELATLTTTGVLVYVGR